MSAHLDSPGLRRLALLSLLGALPVLVDPGAIERASQLVGELPAGSGYLPRIAPLLVWVIVPIVAASATLLVMMPGLLVALSLERVRTFDDWMVQGFTLSLVLVSTASGLLQALVGAPVKGTAYAVFLLSLSAIAWGTLAWRQSRGPVPWPVVEGSASVRLVWTAVAWGVAVLGLMPKLLWESFNGDGAHSFESARLLLHYAMPFWSPDAGPIAGFPGMTSMLYAFPDAWFLRLFGEVPFAARIPFLLYLVVLASALRRLGSILLPGEVRTPPGARTALALGLAAFALAMAFSATYSPYNADIALPATQDTLLMIVVCAAFAAAAAREWWWLLLYTFLVYVSLPSGLLLIGFWLVARALTAWPLRDREARREVLLGLGALLLAMAGSGVLGRLVVASGGAPPGGEYGVVGLLRYFAFIQFTDVRRLLYVAVPAGLLPFILLAAWRSQDRLARSLTLVTLAYFAFFFVQAHVSLHHFVPAMILPVAVAWRVVHSSQHGRVLAKAWVPAAALAVVLAIPARGFFIHRDAREVGRRIFVRIPGYEVSAPAPMRASTLFDQLFPYDWDPAMPATYGGSPVAWNHYARRGTAPDDYTNYILQLTTDPAPAGGRLVAQDSAGASLWVLNDSILASDRARQPRTPAGSRWLEVPRGILFHSVPRAGGPEIVDVAELLESWGFDPDAWLALLGVRRGA